MTKRTFQMGRGAWINVYESTVPYVDEERNKRWG